MNSRIVLFAGLVTLAIGAGSARAQHLPSPGADFDRVLRMAAAEVEAGRMERAGRLALLARARILQYPDGTTEELILKAFDDVTSDAATRARTYVEASTGFGEAFGALGPVPDALAELARPLLEQIDTLIERNYRECALIVLEPVWALAPADALDALPRIRAIRDMKDGDGKLSASLRLSETMARGVSGAMTVEIPVDDANQKPIIELRRNTALAMVDVAKAALDEGLPWVAIDVAGLATTTFPLTPNRFEDVVADARLALAKERDAASKSVVTELFKRGKKSLSSKSWSVTSDSVKFPSAKGKPGLIVTKDPIDGDFRFAMEVTSDFENVPPGFVFAHRSDDDFCVAIFMKYKGSAAVKVERYVDGEPQRLHWWDGAAGVDTQANEATWPLGFERYGKDVWLRIGAEWIRFDAKDVDLTGAIGLYLYEKAEGKRKAEASQFEFEAVPAP